MLKRIAFLLVLLLLFPLLFVGCREAEENISNSDTKEDEPNSQAVDNSNIEPIQSDADDLRGVDSNNASADGNVSAFTPIVVRWGSVVENIVYGDKKLVVVNVEVLDVAKYAWDYDDVCALDAIYLPENALKYVAEGEESLVFAFCEFGRINEEGEYVYVAYMETIPDEVDWPYAIFRFEDNRMIMDEVQMEALETGYCVIFFKIMHAINNYRFAEYGIDEKYHFRNGMTVEELEEFYEAVKSLP